MDQSVVAAIVWLIVMVAMAAIFGRQRGRRGRVGAGATGAVYDMLNEDRRKAIEIIVEERAGARDPEHRDGNLPELEKPRDSRD
jgi:hypothetical protein